MNPLVQMLSITSSLSGRTVIYCKVRGIGRVFAIRGFNHWMFLERNALSVNEQTQLDAELDAMVVSLDGS